MISQFLSSSAMKFFRAQLLRPGYNEVEQGVNKSKDAIENCLCRDGFTFDGMKEVLNILLEIIYKYYIYNNSILFKYYMSIILNSFFIS